MNGSAEPPVVHFVRDAPAKDDGAARQTLAALDPGGRTVGTLDFQICHACRRGLIHTIDVVVHWRDQGVARETLHVLLAQACGGDYSWSTTRQTRDGRGFFATMEEETEVAFPADATKCSHIRARRRRSPDGT
ncbi:hypothetical protein RB200_00125 [Streptomyces sp. PmtG]